MIIAHRLSTVAIADRVLVIDHGAIVEDGSPEDLLIGGGEYSELHQSWLRSLGLTLSGGSGTARCAGESPS